MQDCQQSVGKVRRRTKTGDAPVDCNVTCLLGLWRQLTHNDGTHVGEVIMTHRLRYLSLVLAV